MELSYHNRFVLNAKRAAKATLLTRYEENDYTVMIVVVAPNTSPDEPVRAASVEQLRRLASRVSVAWKVKV